MDISIVIPTFNHEQFLYEAIVSAQESLLFAEVVGEIIVINDGSKDGTADLLKRIPGITFHNQENQGAHAAINTGIQMATGDLVAILNDDDIYLQHHIRWCFNRFNFSPIDFLLTKPLIFGQGEKIAKLELHMNVAESLISKFGPWEAMRRLNWAVSTSAFVLRKRVWEELGGFHNYKMSHDWDFMLRAMELSGLLMARESRPSWKYRCHGANSGDLMGQQEIDHEMAQLRQKYALPDWNLASF